MNRFIRFVTCADLLRAKGDEWSLASSSQKLLFKLFLTLANLDSTTPKLTIFRIDKSQEQAVVYAAHIAWIHTVQCRATSTPSQRLWSTGRNHLPAATQLAGNFPFIADLKNFKLKIRLLNWD